MYGEGEKERKELGRERRVGHKVGFTLVHTLR